MTRRWIAAPAAAIMLATLFTGLTGGCSAKHEEGTPGTPTAEQAKASQEAGERAKAGAEAQGAAMAAQHK